MNPYAEFMKALEAYVDARTFYRAHLNDMRAERLEQETRDRMEAALATLLSVVVGHAIGTA